MNETLEEIKTCLEEIVSSIKSTSTSNTPFGIAHNNWAIPNLTFAELIKEAQDIIDLIEGQGGEDLGEHEALLQDYMNRLQFLERETVGQLRDNPVQAVPAYLMTLQALRKALAPVLDSDKQRAEADGKLKRLIQRVRTMESRFNNLESQAANFSTMVECIEQAGEAADQLSTRLDSLSEVEKKAEDIANDVECHKNDVLRAKEHIVEFEKQLKQYENEAHKILQNCDSAYVAATSVGLAAAFNERSSALSKSMWFWIGGLVLALGFGIYLGTARLSSLGKSFEDPNIPVSIIVLNFLLSVLSVGAPVWFAWLSTKQIGQRFRLAEDYAFKASISRAYEGYRREASRFGKDMEAKLLTSALTRLDELPLRLVETESYGSPWDELTRTKKPTVRSDKPKPTASIAASDIKEDHE